MEKQLGWGHTLDVSESLGISKVGQTVLTRLMESQYVTSLQALWLCGVRAQKKDNGLHLLGARHPSFFQYAIGAF